MFRLFFLVITAYTLAHPFPALTKERATADVTVSLTSSSVGNIQQVQRYTGESGMRRWREIGDSVQLKDKISLSPNKLYSIRLNYSGAQNLSFLDKFPDVIAQIDFNHLAIDAASCKHMTRFVNLKALDAAKSDISDAALTEICKIKNLELLRLTRSLITTNDMKELKNLRHLQFLNVAHIMLDDESLSALDDLTELISLKLESAHISDIGMTHLSKLINLHVLNLKHNLGVTDSGITNLAHLNKIVELDLSDTGISVKTIPVLKQQFPKLETLSISYHKIGKTGLAQLKSNFPKLELHNGDEVAWPLQMFEPLHSPMPAKSKE